MSRYGIVAPLAAEAACAAKLARRAPDRVSLQCSGMGPDNVATACRTLVEGGARTLVSFGFAGGLDARLPSGSLLLPERVMTPDGHGTSVLGAPTVADRFEQRFPERCACGPMLTVPGEIAQPSDKAALHAALGVVAVDMESAIVGAMAAELGVGFLVLRAVLDDAREALPDGLTATVDAYGRPKPLALARWLLRNPMAIPSLMRLGKARTVASRTLTAALAVLVEDNG